jgi:hypothetical protein
MGANKNWVIEHQDAQFKFDYDDYGVADMNTGSMVTTALTEGLDFDSLTPHDDQMAKKYPALQQAWDHYQIVLKMCKAKEEEA